MLDAPVDFEAAVPVRPAVAASRTIRTARRFDLVGFRWRAGAEPRIRLRVRRAGRWSRWVQAPHAHAPLRRRGQEGSDPVWAGGADAYQVRVSGRAPGLRAHFVSVPRRPRPLARRAAAGGGPPIVSRAQWGASRCPPRRSPDYGRVEVGFVHHTVNANDYTAAEAPGIVLAICRYHRYSNGWDDIGYNFVVDRHGQVFEGRAGGIDRPVVGSQAAGYNSVSTGIANLGEFSREPQTAPGTDALARLLAWKLGVHGVPAEGRVTVRGRTFERISGHRDANSTACPGNSLYAQLPELRRLVAAGGGFAGGLALAAPARVRVPDVPTFGGTLADPGGVPLGGRSIELQARTSSGAWRVVAGAVTNPDGTWALGLPTTRSGVFRAHFAGDEAAPPATTAAWRLAVLPRLEVRATRTRVRRGQVVTLVGSMSPRKRALEVLVWRRVRGANRFAGRFRAVARGRGISARVRVRSASLYRFQVVSRADRANAAGASNVVWVRSVS